MSDLLVHCNRRRKLNSKGKGEGEEEKDDIFMELPPDHISELILEKLIPYSKDYFRFGAVCKQWFSILMDDLHRRRRSQSQFIPPLLLVPTNPNSNSKVSVSHLYNVTYRKILDGLNIKVPYGDDIHINIDEVDEDGIGSFCGSSYGWLSFSLKSYEIVLYDPFVSQKHHYIRLPPVTPYPFDKPLNWWDSFDLEDDDDEDTNYGKYEKNRVYKLILSADPRTTDDYVVAVIYGPFKRLALFKPSYNNTASIKSFDFRFQSWTYLEEDDYDNVIKPSRYHDVVKPPAFDDVLFHKGLVYAINGGYRSEIYVIQVDGLVSGNGGTIRASNQILLPLVLCLHKQWLGYLCETSSTKELLVIIRLFRSKDDHSTKVIQVFKQTGTDWVNLEDLDGEAVFIGRSQSISIVASSASTGCHANSIYFTHDCPLRNHCIGHHDMGIYSLEESAVTMHYNQDPAHKLLPSPIWILPMF